VSGLDLVPRPAERDGIQFGRYWKACAAQSYLTFTPSGPEQGRKVLSSSQCRITAHMHISTSIHSLSMSCVCDKSMFREFPTTLQDEDGYHDQGAIILMA